MGSGPADVPGGDRLERSRRSVERATAELKGAGLKVTLPRLKVHEVLQRADPHHISVEEVYRTLQSGRNGLGLATVYRVLARFEEAGVVVRHHFSDGGFVYELAPARHHDHMVDVESGDVVEFASDAMEALKREVAESRGFDLLSHELILYVRRRRDR